MATEAVDVTLLLRTVLRLVLPVYGLWRSYEKSEILTALVRNIAYR